jgi:hypothetical protein
MADYNTSIEECFREGDLTKYLKLYDERLYMEHCVTIEEKISIALKNKHGNFVIVIIKLKKYPHALKIYAEFAMIYGCKYNDLKVVQYFTTVSVCKHTIKQLLDFDMDIKCLQHVHQYIVDYDKGLNNAISYGNNKALQFYVTKLRWWPITSESIQKLFSDDNVNGIEILSKNYTPPIFVCNEAAAISLKWLKHYIDTGYPVSPITIAISIQNSNSDCFDYLIESGYMTDVDAICCIYGNRYLHVAILHNHKEIFIKLVNLGCQVTIELYIDAIQCNHLEMVELLIEHNMVLTNDIFMDKLKMMTVEMFEFLVDKWSKLYSTNTIIQLIIYDQPSKLSHILSNANEDHKGLMKQHKSAKCMEHYNVSNSWF